MTVIVVVCGQRNSGKTSWVCALVEALSAKGIKVGTVKHTHHRHDVEGKDTDRHQKAGADRVMLVSPDGAALYRAWENELSLAAVVETYFDDFEIVLAEGYRETKHPKIIVGDDPRANTDSVIARVPIAIDGVVDAVRLRETRDLILATF